MKRVINFTVILVALACASTASADVPAAPVLEQVPLAQEEGVANLQAVVDQINAAAAGVKCKTKKKKKKKVKTCTKVSLGDQYSDLQDEFSDAVNGANDDVSSREDDRRTFFSEWFEDYQTSITQPLDDDNEAKTNSINDAYDTQDEVITNQLEATNSALEAQRNALVAQGGAAVIAARKARCAAKYKKKSQAAKLKRCNKIAAKRVLPEDIENAADDWLNDAMNDAADANADLAEASSKDRDRALDKQAAVYERTQAGNQRGFDKIEKRADRTLNKIQSREQKSVDRIAKIGQKALDEKLSE